MRQKLGGAVSAIALGMASVFGLAVDGALEDAQAGTRPGHAAPMSSLSGNILKFGPGKSRDALLKTKESDRPALIEELKAGIAKQIKIIKDEVAALKNGQSPTRSASLSQEFAARIDYYVTIFDANRRENKAFVFDQKEQAGLDEIVRDAPVYFEGLLKLVEGLLKGPEVKAESKTVLVPGIPA